MDCRTCSNNTRNCLTQLNFSYAYNAVNCRTTRNVSSCYCCTKLNTREVIKEESVTSCCLSRSGLDLCRCLRILQIVQTITDCCITNDIQIIFNNDLTSSRVENEFTAKGIYFGGRGTSTNRNVGDGCYTSDSEVVGGIIKAKMNKSRFTKESTVSETRLFFDERGLDKYYGLLPLAEKYGIIPKEGKQYIFNGKKYYESSIIKEPEKFFTPEIMEGLEIAAAQEFKLK